MTKLKSECWSGLGRGELQERGELMRIAAFLALWTDFEKALEKFARENNRDVVTRDSVARCSIAAVGDDITK